MKLRPWSSDESFHDRTGYHFRCPACMEPHTITDQWTVTGADTDTPTISPSILVRGFQKVQGVDGRWTGEWVYDEGRVLPVPSVCHSFVRNGSIEFLSDCTHDMAGTTVPLPDWVRYGTEAQP